MTRFDAKERLTRLLAVIPHVAGRGFVPVDEIVERFAYPRKELVADLTEVVQFVGVAPFTPDSMIEVIVEDDRVRIDYADWFSRPMRLTPHEGLALLAAGRTLAALDAGQGDDDKAGPGALVRGLTKLGAALGGEPDDALDISLGAAPEEVLSPLRRAVRERRAVHIDYYSYGRDRRSSRVIEPHRFFADEGNWYVRAYCRAAGGDRVFRLDRVHSVELLEDTFEAPGHADPEPPAPFSPPPGAPRVVLELAPPAAWVAARYPHEGAEHLAGGRIRLSLAVSALAWLERLLLRLGDQVDVVELPDGWGPDPRAAAARRILDRYEVSGE